MQCFFLLFFFCLFTMTCCKVKPVERMKRWTDYFGVMWENLDIELHWSSRLIPMIFIVKRLSITAMCIYFNLSSLVTLQVIQLMHIAFLLHARPYLDDGDRKREIFTESIIMMLLYFLNAFREDLHDPEVQYKYGWVGVAIISIYLIYHMSKAIVGFVCVAKTKCKTYCCKDKQDKSNPKADEEGVIHAKLKKMKLPAVLDDFVDKSKFKKAEMEVIQEE